MVRLVAADMDGTLLDSRKRLSPEFMPMLEKLKANGVHFVVSSGRQYYNLRKIFPDAEKLAFICDNGSLVFEEGENIFCNEIEHGDLVAPVETIRSVGGVFAVLSGVKSAYVESENPEFLRNAGMYYERLAVVPDVLEAAKNDRICKIASFDLDGSEFHSYPIIRDRFSARFAVCLAGPQWTDLTNPGVDKGQAIRFLQKRYGVTFEESMAFGDYLNDSAMMQACFYSYAMGNAHPDLKKLCRFEAESNDRDGVVRVLKREFPF